MGGSVPRTERNDEQRERDSGAGAQQSSRRQRAPAVHPHATLNVDLHHAERVAAEKQMQLGFRIAGGVVFGKQRDGTRPQRPEA